MIDFTIRCSELFNIMTDPKASSSTMTKKFETIDGEVISIKLPNPDKPAKLKDALSQGAKTYIETMARRYVYKYESEINSKYLDKGIAVEDDAIALYNSVFFCNATKNKERKIVKVADGCFLSGECDIDIKSLKKIVDIKCPWSLEQFPETKASAKKDAEKAGYDWQGRGYMMLWDYDMFEVAYCMVSTPDYLIPEYMIGHSMHSVDRIDPELRITTAQWARDKEIEQKIKLRIFEAGLYFNEMVKVILDDHKH